MGDKTGIAWTDSTMNWWEGCTKVGPGCDHCYAETRDIRYHEGAHWGPGAPRRRMSEHTRNNLKRWQNKAAEFVAARGHRQRVFCSSLSDIFDNEVPAEWRAEAFADMAAAPDLLIQICTKRVSNVRKMVPDGWARGLLAVGRGGTARWPANVGLLITVVTPEEVLRDVPRLLALKAEFGIPWVGLSVEPLISDVADALDTVLGSQGPGAARLDWAILGGESGTQARPYDLHWASAAIECCNRYGVAVFHKQLGDAPVFNGKPFEATGKGESPDEWPPALRVREFPPALNA